ncbi:hypothetical protein ACIRN4_05415 [Pimelobacter simplex]|uniref:hypothetical protein n=1 Tax=Nocardioides simplex TaxID=2045 RepID=UPI003814FC0D
MPRTKRAPLVISVVAALLLAVSAASAHAATTYTPGPGSVRLIGAGITFTNIPMDQKISCTQFDLAGPVIAPGSSRGYGADLASLTTLTSSGCSNPLLGVVTATPLGPWGLAISGDPVAGTWPAKFTHVTIAMTWGGCAFRVEGAVSGRFSTVTQRFTPDAGASGLSISSTWPGAPTGALCVSLDILPGDEFAVGGYWTNVPPAGSGPLTISNP